MTPYIPFSHPLNTHKTIQTPSSLVDSYLDSYSVSLVSVGCNYYLSFIGCSSMSLVILGLTLYMFGSDINTYGSYFRSIKHSNLIIYQFYPVVHHFPTMTLYTHGNTIPLVFCSLYDTNSDISESLKLHLIFGKVLHHFG